MSLTLTLPELIARLRPEHGALVERLADPGRWANRLAVSGARALDLAGEADLVFCKDEQEERLGALLATRSRLVVARPEIAALLPASFASERALVLTARPRLLLALLLAPLDHPPAVAFQEQAIHPRARVDPSARLGHGVVLGADVEIGPDCVICPNTVIHHTTIGARTVIGSNCSIGGDGYGYEIDEELGEIVKFPHFGHVYIGNDVEISDNVCVDRGSLRDTLIEDEVKVDNLVHIAHNCVIQRGAFVIAHAMLGGSSTVGAYAWVAPSTALINGGELGRCAMTGLGAVVLKPVAANTIAVGVPAKPLRERFPEGFKLL